MKKWQKKIHEIIFGYSTWEGKAFDLVLLIIILTSVIIVMLESVTSIKTEHGDELRVIEWILTAMFTVEYAARIFSSPKPIRYIFSFMGIVDLVSLVPTYLGFFIEGAYALSVIRSVRLIRVFRILKLTHFMGGAKQLGDGLWATRHKIIVFLGSVMCVVVVTGTLMYMIEGGENGFTSIPKSIYWTIVTITTVGYGDIAPQTIFGQTMASVLMILGYAIIAVPTGIVTQQMMSNKKSNKANCDRCGYDELDEKDRYCRQCGLKL